MKEKPVIEIISLLIIIVLLCVLLFHYSTDSFREIDVFVFFQYSENIWNGLVPYRDFVVEFPPVSLVFYCVPHLLSSDSESYVIAFAAMVAALSVLTYLVSLGLLKEMDCDRYQKIIFTVVYIILLNFYFPNLAGKFDMAVVFLTVLGIYLFVKGYRIPAYVIVTVAMLTKFYPGLVLLLFLLMDCKKEYEPRAVFERLAIIVLAVFACLLPVLIWGAGLDQILSCITFHSNRGFQVESSVAVIVQFLGDFGIGSYSIAEHYHTYDVVSPATDFLSPFWTYVVIGLILGGYVFIWHHLSTRGAPDNTRDLTERMSRYFLLLLLLFLLTNKVFSTQYIVWILPWFVLNGLGTSRFYAIAYAVMYALIVILSKQTGSELFSTFFMIRLMLLVTGLILLIRMLMIDRTVGDEAVSC